MSAAPPFQAFLDEHSVVVWRYLVSTVGRCEAEDCFQETFISALKAYPRLDTGGNPRAWVLTIAHRKALDAHRRRARGPLPVADAAALDDPPAAEEARWLEAPELWGAVARLPERQRAAVALRFIADLAHREIAQALGCTEEAARRSLHEGLSKLRSEVAA